MNMDNLQAEVVKFDSETNEESVDFLSMEMLERNFPYSEMREQQRYIFEQLVDN